LEHEFNSLSCGVFGDARLLRCASAGKNPVGSNDACKAAQAAYEIEFGDKRALDDLIIAKSILSQLPSDVNMNDPTQVAGAAVKYSKVVAALEQAARDRFRSLKGSPKGTTPGESGWDALLVQKCNRLFGVADDEALGMLVEHPGRREAARGWR
jgi:hypothetical protein